ncbi:hypothetical protein [Flavicella sp.]|uniref:hypothetical protein n=1 Tax=Flavicella sp. TaxID=2957742 RepID=UPI00261E4B1F|nr:hypothetical protein [Flavicella sp.]MDG1804103.1 hypothetical protein [Flavicella sp.]
MKYVYKIILVLFGFITVISCEDNPELNSNFNYLTFGDTPDITVNQNSTYEQAVLFYSSQNSGSERIINLTIDADNTSADENTYSFPNSVSIPANSNIGEFIITITDVNIGDSGESLTIAFNNTEDGIFTGDNLNLNIFRFCPLDINNFIGDYTITEAGYGDYDTTITLDPTIDNRIWVTNFWDWTTDLAYYDFNPEDGTIVMPSQPIVMGDGQTYNCVGSGTYNACNGTFHMEYQGDVAGTIHDFTPK